LSPLVNKEKKRSNKHRRMKKSKARMKKNNKGNRKKGKVTDNAKAIIGAMVNKHISLYI
jgi:hypothetical protein